MGTVGGFLLGLGLFGFMLWLIARFSWRRESTSAAGDDARFLQHNMTEVVLDELRSQGFGATIGAIADVPTRTARLGDLHITFTDELCATCGRCLKSAVHEFWPSMLPTMPPVIVTLRHVLIARFCAFCGDVTKPESANVSGVFGILLQEGTNLHRMLRRDPGGESEAQLLRAIHDSVMEAGKTSAEVVAMFRQAKSAPSGGNGDGGGGGQNSPASGGGFVH